jgi:predicted SprT family Zn-dependent metalloprotease
MNTAEAEQLAKSLMAEHGLAGWRFKWSNAKRQFGVCEPLRRTIRLSQPMVELNDDAEVRDTILHEIAHALCPLKEGHGAAWKEKVQAIGGKADRCCGDEVIAPAPKFIGICPGCSKITRAHRRGDVSCRDCSGGQYNPAFALLWDDTTTAPLVPEVLSEPTFSAHDAASYVKARWAAGKDATLDAYRAMLDVGETLLKVKAYWRSKVALAEWWKLYEIPFSQRWGNTLMRASQQRDAIVSELEAQMAERVPNLKKALQVAEGKALPTGTQVPVPEPEADPDTDGGLDDGDLVLRNPEPPEPDPKPPPLPPKPTVTLAEHIDASADDVEGLVPWVESFDPAKLDTADAAALNALAEVDFELATVCGDKSAAVTEAEAT